MPPRSPARLAARLGLVVRLGLGAALALALTAPDAAAQRRPALTPRFGLGFEATGVPAGRGVIPDGLGVGLHGRIALPVNADLSAGVGIGLDAFVLDGSDGADYVASPEAAVILTLPRRGSGGARYLLGGVSGYVPLTDGGGPGGPALFVGMGWAFPLRETSFYLEVAPALVVGEDAVTVAIPARAGVIF